MVQVMAETVRDGRFVLMGTLGHGAQGQTFDGVDKREGRPVAIKRFDVRGARTWKEADLAEREARVLQSLTHAKLPRYVDHFEQDGALYLVMEKIEGESLASLRRRGVVFAEADVVRFLSDASEVLEYLHSRTPPVIHRDLKPGNVIRKPDGSFAFVDFGSVRDKLRPEGGSTVVGTFGYMAPEQFQGRAFTGSDVYGIAATGLAMLTGREPEDLPHRGLTLDVRAALPKGTRGALVNVLARMLDPDPDRRASKIAPLLATLTNDERRQQQTRGNRDRSYDSFDPSDVGSWRDRASARFEWHAQDLERRADEYERRAAAGGFGAKGWSEGAAKLRKAAQKVRNSLRRDAARAESHGRRASRRAAWESTSPAFRHGHHGHWPPWPVRLLVTLVFAIGMLAVLTATQVVVPAVLRFLSLFFARRALADASTAVMRAGQNAVRDMNRSRRWFRGDHLSPQTHEEPLREPVGEADERVRVESDPGNRTRISDDDHDGGGEDEYEETAAANRTDKRGS